MCIHTKCAIEEEEPMVMISSSYDLLITFFSNVMGFSHASLFYVLDDSFVLTYQVYLV